MKRFTVGMTMAIACLAAVSAPALAAKMSERHDGKTQSMQAMMQEPHHMLAMAYKDNLLTFARVLRQPPGRGQTRSIDLARGAVAEIRRSFDLMKEHCEDHAVTMSDEVRTRKSRMIQQMDTMMARIGDNIVSLEHEVSYSTLDEKRISVLTDAIIHECDHMSRMHMPSMSSKYKGRSR